MNPNSLRNLKPWARGTSGNAGGRPKTLVPHPNAPVGQDRAELRAVLVCENARNGYQYWLRVWVGMGLPIPALAYDAG